MRRQIFYHENSVSVIIIIPDSNAQVLLDLTMVSPWLCHQLDCLDCQYTAKPVSQSILVSLTLGFRQTPYIDRSLIQDRSHSETVVESDQSIVCCMGRVISVSISFAS